jgi:hypothetical protein
MDSIGNLEMGLPSALVLHQFAARRRQLGLELFPRSGMQIREGGVKGAMLRPRKSRTPVAHDAGVAEVRHGL